jgi:hypothetical protein
VRPSRLYDELLRRGRGHARDAARALLAALREDMGHVVAVSHTILVGVAGRHSVAAIVEDAAHQDGSESFIRTRRTRTFSASRAWHGHWMPYLLRQRAGRNPMTLPTPGTRRP